MANSLEQDQRFMRLALRQAVRAQGRTSPNPLVGAVIVKDGTVIASGYHRKAGTPHAEINAIAKAPPEIIRGSTLYVTLEPCSHHGRTPPCCEAVAHCGISRVVVGMVDPNPLVAGRGIRYLQDRGVEVVSGIMNEECHRINRAFCHWITTGQPWVIMKAGMSLDGKIAARTGNSGWITNELSRRYVHQLRDKVDAILVGIGTALADDPSLTTRLPGRNHRDPLRVILDRDLRLPPNARVLAQDSNAPTMICCGPNADHGRAEALVAAGAIIQTVELGAEDLLDLRGVLKILGRRQVTSLLVEGGSRVHGTFWAQGLVDQVKLFYGPLMLGGDGISLLGQLGLDRVDQARRLSSITHRRFGDDLMIEGFLG